MRYRLQICVLVAMLAAIGCSSTASTNPDDYVGEYVFKPSNSAPGDFANFLILKKDHTALEIKVSKETEQVTNTETKWDLSNRNGEYVGIGNFSHPVEGSSTHIKLGINDDLGQYYEKVR
jgi:hypothetical protein